MIGACQLIDQELHISRGPGNVRTVLLLSNKMYLVVSCVVSGLLFFPGPQRVNYCIETMFLMYGVSHVMMLMDVCG